MVDIFFREIQLLQTLRDNDNYQLHLTVRQIYIFLK